MPRTKHTGTQHPDKPPAHRFPDSADSLTLLARASRVTLFEAQRVPEALQTRAYAARLADGDPLLANDEVRDAAVRAVTGLQKAWRANGTEIDIILGEAALHQQIGGPDVMAPQLSRLRETATDSGRVSIRLLPFGSRGHPSPRVGSLALLHFAGSPDPAIALAGGTPHGIILDDPADVAACTRILDRAAALALPPGKSAIALRGLGTNRERPQSTAALQPNAPVRLCPVPVRASSKFPIAGHPDSTSTSNS